MLWVEWVVCKNLTSNIIYILYTIIIYVCLYRLLSVVYYTLLLGMHITYVSRYIYIIMSFTACMCTCTYVHEAIMSIYFTLFT